ncbi:MAG: 50S ribosomal protein L4 [Acidobacteriota bacterium]|nr:50S ribosomal protein L4 [Acidobacteriota bacterium]
MPTVKVRNIKNEEIGDVELSDAVFGAELNEGLIHAALKNFLANARQGTVGTKTRGDVSGSGRKLWKQKGTGRARIASIRSPLWKGGGNTHGPQARDWSYSMPKKMRRGALRSALSERLREGNLVVLDGFTLSQPKTKEFIGTLLGLGMEGRTLIVDSLENDNLLLASRNVKRTKIVGSQSLNIYDLLYHEKLVLSRAAAEELARMLAPQQQPAAEAAAADDETAARTDDVAADDDAATTNDGTAATTTEEAA